VKIFPGIKEKCTCSTVGDLFKVQCSGVTKILVDIVMTLRVERRYNNAAAIYKGYVMQC
jgi:hypothetical protein